MNFDQVVEYNLLGIDESSLPVNGQIEISKVLADAFLDFHRSMKKEIKANLHLMLYGNFSKIEAERILYRYPTVEEGMKHIPGILSKERDQHFKTVMINLLLERLESLIQYGQTQRLLKTDFREVKANLLRLLFEQFGCHLDMGSFDSTMRRIKELKLIPDDLAFESLAKLCPIGRWF